MEIGVKLSRVAYEAVFPRWRPREEFCPRGNAPAREASAMRVLWLGTAAHVIETREATLLIDPFVSRPSLFEVAASGLTSNERVIEARIPKRVDAILCGHSHFDHLLDAPFIAKKTGAKIVGSKTTCSFALASGVPRDQIIEIGPHGGEVQINDAQIRFVPSKHGRIFPIGVPFPGEVLSRPKLPARFFHYRMGGAFGLLIKSRGMSLYHNGSADLVDAELDGEHADVLLVGLAGRQRTPDYLARLTHALRPSLIVPTHHDAFFAPTDDGVRLLPRIDLDGFLREASAIARVITPGYDEPIAIPEGNAKDAILGVTRASL